MQNEYRGLIFTNHVLERMRERGITKENIWETMTTPDKQDSIKNEDRRSKTFQDYEVTVVFKHSDKRETIIISAWSDPPIPGTRDAKEKEWYTNYKKAGFWGKIWLTALKQAGL